jgi:hypothetical protein
MCYVLLPPGVNPTAVKYIYHIIPCRVKSIFSTRHGWRKWTKSCHKTLFQNRSISDRNTSTGAKCLWEWGSERIKRVWVVFSISKTLKFLQDTETGHRSYPRRAHALTAHNFRQSSATAGVQCTVCGQWDFQTIGSERVANAASVIFGIAFCPPKYSWTGHAEVTCKETPTPRHFATTSRPARQQLHRPKTMHCTIAGCKYTIFLKTSDPRWWVVNICAPAALPLVRIEQECTWVPETVWAFWRK